MDNNNQDSLRKMEKLITPFGEIKILIDGTSVPYLVKEGSKLEALCLHLLGRYQITVHFMPDGKEHTLACIFEPECSFNRSPEGGERLECQGFYNDSRMKMSIGVECEAGYIGSVRASEGYDYDAGYLENGMSYCIEADTKTELYVFGIAWIDDVGWDDPNDYNRHRDVETWYGADPTLAL